MAFGCSLSRMSVTPPRSGRVNARPLLATYPSPLACSSRAAMGRDARCGRAATRSSCSTRGAGRRGLGAGTVVRGTVRVPGPRRTVRVRRIRSRRSAGWGGSYPSRRAGAGDAGEDAGDGDAALESRLRVLTENHRVEGDREVRYWSRASLPTRDPLTFRPIPRHLEIPAPLSSAATPPSR